MSQIKILEVDNNRRGDLFGKLMSDLFVAIGYDQPRLNIHRSGREVDVAAYHRTEKRKAVAECKAVEEKVGGSDVNKFVGVMDAEHEDGVELCGYFISLSGFTETEIDQSKNRKTKVIHFVANDVIEQLIVGNRIISPERATEAAGRVCGLRQHLTLIGQPELLAHQRGWIWLIRYADGGAQTSFALIHADGTILAKAVADEVVRADKGCGGDLHALVCLNPTSLASSHSAENIKNAFNAYKSYLLEDCGYIQLDGLPADGEVGSQRLRLEKLFVPLHLSIDSTNIRRQRIAQALQANSRLAILAAPGAGKSTLIKHLAISIIDSAKKASVFPELNDRDWFPLYFRCRDLRENARSSFANLVVAVSNRDPIRIHAEAFRALVDQQLMAGNVLLLVDGLDEISNPGDRATFVSTLRTAIQAYDRTSIIITSREAGFRHVASQIAPICTIARLSPFDHEDIQRLTVAWHRLVIGDSSNIQNDALQLAATIIANDRIGRLAVNPLLLTTLLLVKRWVGSLPTRRAILYGKAVEVLLATWNVEGHHPISEDEALPQLCFVAVSMMLGRMEKISRPNLSRLIADARRSLPSELGYVKESVDEFIRRVEERSSLLMMTGIDVENDQLVDFFEFRHLTFQEFLTARALVEGWHPNAREGESLFDLLRPHLSDEKWREVVPLVACLAGKATDNLIKKLTELVAASVPERPESRDIIYLHELLGHCLADEAPARPDTIASAMSAIMGKGKYLDRLSFLPSLLRGKYGQQWQALVADYFRSETDIGAALTVLQATRVAQYLFTPEPVATDPLLDNLIGMLTHDDLLVQCSGALVLAEYVGFQRRNSLPSDLVLSQIETSAMLLLNSTNASAQYAAGWLFFELSKNKSWVSVDEAGLYGRLAYLIMHSDVADVRRALSTTVLAAPTFERSSTKKFANLNSDEVYEWSTRWRQFLSEDEKAVALVIAWHTRAMEDDELAIQIEKLNPFRNTRFRHIKDIFDSISKK